MIKLSVISDVHFDYGNVDEKLDIINKEIAENDHLVLAGDLTNGNCKDKFEILSKINNREKVIAVIGNHDCWGITIKECEKFFRTMFPNTLLNSLLVINGVSIYGGTLWFPRNPIALRIGKRWPDLRFVKNPDDIYEQNLAFINGFVHTTPDIVISHHLPSPCSTPLKFTSAENNVFFVCNLEKEVLEYKPKLWIHGHTHDDFDYNLGNTRIVCNPYGYPQEKYFNVKRVEI